MPKKADIIAALLRERRGYEINGDKDAIAGVDAELKRLGENPKPPAKRATTLKRKPEAKL